MVLEIQRVVSTTKRQDRGTVYVVVTDMLDFLLPFPGKIAAQR